ncbi:acetolactate synthase 3 large subunit [Rhizobium sp. CCGE531]|uniref:acetolactate synthase 3 large subunit n=1 Tax=Rhizobium sp. CCGE531 TaxID=2364271 RepID=UPI000EA942D5|nr:acetolactate synthase 3 large subunit [Rhizobium sp. CCGE531]AYG66065.1 acetolactate synthase 3 large subunit [Rhizobium sp. CCGE531]
MNSDGEGEAVMDSAVEVETLKGAEIIVRALRDNGVGTIFGYPGGAVLPIYDVLFQQADIRHVLVRHEQGAGHAAEGYARSTGQVGVVLVTSGPGVTNMITPLQDALMDSVPIVCISGQVPTTLIGTDAFQECDTAGITRPCTKHNFVVTDVSHLAATIHDAFRIAISGRPGPVLVDVPKDFQLAIGPYADRPRTRLAAPPQPVCATDIKTAADLIINARKGIIYTGGGVINSGPEASALLRQLVAKTGFPITSTLMGLGAYPATGKAWLGMLGLHGTYEANMAMNQCDVMLCIGARFDDRVTGRVDRFSPHSRKIHIDIDSSSINKIVQADVKIRSDAAEAMRNLLQALDTRSQRLSPERVKDWWRQIETWRALNSLAYRPRKDEIMPQFALERLWAMIKDRNPYITTEVGQHQMWAAQYCGVYEPQRFIKSGGLGTMGFGLPAAIGVQVAHPDELVVDVAGDASIQMNIREIATAVQYRASVKVFILNNHHLGMVRQLQQHFHLNRKSHSYSAAMPDFVKLADAYGAHGIRCDHPDDLDDAIEEMISIDGPVVFDCRVTNLENCYPMIKPGAAHDQMWLNDIGETHLMSTEHTPAVL